MAGADVRGGRAARPRLVPGARTSHVPRDGRVGHHGRGGVPLPAPPGRRHAVRRPQRHGPRAAAGGAGRRPADPAPRHGLPQQRLRRAARRRPARGSATAPPTRWAERVAGPRGRRRRHPLRPRRPRRPAPHDRGGRGGQAPPRAPVGADRGERRLRRGVRRHPHPAARRPRRARPADQRRARDPPDRRRRRHTSAPPVPSPASAPPPSATSATASARAGACTTRAAR